MSTTTPTQNLPPTDDTQIFTTAEKRLLQNLQSSTFSSPVPPPYVGNLKVTTITKDAVTLDWTLLVSWLDLTNLAYPVQQYNVFATSDTTDYPILVASVPKSPAKIILRTPVSSKYIISVQTVLQNGATNSIAGAPTATVA